VPELIQDHEWGPGPRPRVVVEAVEWGAREHAAAVLREHGYEAVTCPGPEGAGQRCRLATGEGCSAVEGADVVVHSLRPWDPRNVEALRALRRRMPAHHVVVEVSGPDAARRKVDLEGCVVLEAPASAAELLDAVARAIGHEPEGD
jgi:hypothetical protein